MIWCIFLLYKSEDKTKYKKKMFVIIQENTKVELINIFTKRHLYCYFCLNDNEATVLWSFFFFMASSSCLFVEVKL